MKRSWADGVLDQAIAADWLVKRCVRADETLFALWLAGYSVEPAAAQRAWLERLERIQHRRQQAAKRYSGGFYGLGRSWWSQLKSNVAFRLPWWQELPNSDRERISNFLGDTQEWLRDDDEHDDDAFRYAIADLIVGLTKTDRQTFYQEIDELWADIDPASLFTITPYLKLVQSISREELQATHESLAIVTNILRKMVELLGSANRGNAVVIPVAFMSEFIGTLIARVLIATHRTAPGLPLKESISILHDLALRVQSIDISHKIDGSVIFSNRIHGEWETTKKYLSQLWTHALEDEIPKQPPSQLGPPDPASG